MLVHETASQVETDFDTANPNEDHSPVSVDLTGTVSMGGTGKRLKRPRHDVDKMLSAEGRQTIAYELRKYQPPGWEVHPDEHCQHLQDYLHDIMSRHFAVDEEAPRASYIPAEIWELRRKKLRLKQTSRHRKSLWTAVLARAFRQWQQNSDYGVHILLQKQALLYDVVAGAVRWATAKIKAGIRKAKDGFLQTLVHQEGDKAGDVLRKAKAAGVGGRRARAISRPLPMLKFDNGQTASSTKDRDQIWLEHFGKQEMGKILPTVQFLREETTLCHDEGPGMDYR